MSHTHTSISSGNGSVTIIPHVLCCNSNVTATYPDNIPDIIYEYAYNERWDLINDALSAVILDDARLSSIGHVVYDTLICVNVTDTDTYKLIGRLHAMLQEKSISK